MPKRKENLLANYDSHAEALYIAALGTQEQVGEIAPGITMEFDPEGKSRGVGILRVSQVLNLTVALSHEKHRGS